MKTRFSESKAEAEEPNQAWEPALRLVNPSASASASDSDNQVFREHKRNVSEVVRNGNVLILIKLRFRRTYDSAYDSDFLFSLGNKRSYHSAYDSDSDSVAGENQPLVALNTRGKGR